MLERSLESKKVLMNGIEIYFEENKIRPNNETIVLLHGFLSSSFSFRRLVPYLLEDYHVITVDLPPFGDSGKTKRYRYSYHNIAKTVLELLNHLKIKSFFIAGHSMGGQIALNVMKLAPERVKKGFFFPAPVTIPGRKVIIYWLLICLSFLSLLNTI